MTFLNPGLLIRGLVLFWGAWFSLVFFSNLADGLRHAGLLPAGWRFVSGNFVLIAQSIEIYSLSAVWAAALFSAVVLFQLTTAILFWRAFLDRQSVVTRDRRKLLQAFSLAIGLFASFLLADEVFIVYSRLPGVATSHLLILSTLLLSLLVIYGLGERPQSG